MCDTILFTECYEAGRGHEAVMLIYKIFRAPEWAELELAGETRGAPVDLADGFLFVGVNDYPPAFYRDPKKIETQVKNTPGYKRLAESNMILARLVLRENKRMPVLGICAGPQLCTIALGGKLIQHVDGHIAHSNIRDREHKITIRGGHIMKRMFGEKSITVNSNHHQAADPDHLGKGLQAVAYAEDGVVEANSMFLNFLVF